MGRVCGSTAIWDKILGSMPYSVDQQIFLRLLETIIPSGADSGDKELMLGVGLTPLEERSPFFRVI